MDNYSKTPLSYVLVQWYDSGLALYTPFNKPTVLLHQKVCIWLRFIVWFHWNAEQAVKRSAVHVWEGLSVSERPILLKKTVPL